MAVKAMMVNVGTSVIRMVERVIRSRRMYLKPSARSAKGDCCLTGPRSWAYSAR